MRKEEEAMKGKVATAIAIGLALALVMGAFVSASAQVAREDLKALCEEGYNNAKATRDIVEKAIANVEKEITPDSSELKVHELEDAKFWFKKADDLFKKCEEKLKKGEYSKQLSIDLNQAWQWFIKAGSAAVRASMQE